MAKLEFPKGFLWGASTSSHQVEGGTHNQWSEWEASPARLAALEREGLVAKHGRENFISGTAADHFHRYREDFRLARELGHNATRISIEWSRVEPDEGRFDDEAIAHYRDVIAEIRRNGMEPFVTLWHWTVPVWFAEKGAFEKARNIPYFIRFAERMAAALPEVRFWITLNEPEIYSGWSYALGLWPPQKKNVFSAVGVHRNLIRAHRAAYPAIKKILPDAQVGVAKPLTWFEAWRGRLWNRLMKAFADRTWNLYFLEHIRDMQDFVGVNHYSHNRIDGWFNRNGNERVSDLGWELYPEAIYHVLMMAKRYGKPIYITENGLADAADAERPWFLRESLRSVHRAIADGADVRGYLHWSLLDNFEWAYGFWPRFGLVAVNYATQARSPRPSASLYGKICGENGFDAE